MRLTVWKILKYKVKYFLKEVLLLYVWLQHDRSGEYKARSSVPRHEIEAIVHTFYPAIAAFFESEEGKALLKSWGMPVEERLLSVDELFEAARTGALEEAWCIGTAAVISPIGALGWGDKCYEINHNRIGELSQKLYDELTGIQWGTKPDPFGWTCPVC